MPGVLSQPGPLKLAPKLLALLAHEVWRRADDVEIANELDSIAEGVAFRKRSSELLLLRSPHLVGTDPALVDCRIILMVKCDYRISRPVLGELDNAARCTLVAHNSFLQF